MENDILDSLQDIKYEGPMKDENNLKKAVEGGPKNIEYSKLVNYISNEIKSVCPLEESINPISSSEDSSSFLMEVSSFLKELGCPYTCLTTGHLSERLRSTADKLLLLEYLLGELMSARMIKVDKPDENNKMEVQLHESETAKYLKEMLLTLQFNKPPPNITPSMLFSKVESKLKETVNRAGSELIGKPAFNGYLSDKQWHTLNEIQKDLNADYTIRRELLLKRLDVTIQSFQWSDKTKGKEELIKNLYNSKAGSLKKNPEIDLGDLLAARDDILIIEKTSSASVRKNTQSSVNKVIIGRVPDRGGRPSEQAPPPPEMPSWQQQRQPSGGRGGGRGGGDRGNYSQGGGGYTRGGSQGGSGGGGGYNRGGLQSGSGYNRDDSSRDYSGNQNRDYGNSGYSGGQNRTSGGNSGGSSYGQGGYDRGGYNRGGSYQQNYQQQTSYADQYVQDSYHNQQYGSRGDSGRNSGGRGGRGGGRSNYSRGGGGSGGYR